jgi:hypothetical protein
MTPGCCSIERTWDSIRSINLFVGNPQPFSEKSSLDFLQLYLKRKKKRLKSYMNIQIYE